MKISELSVKRPVAVSMIVLIFLVIGIYSLTMLPMESMPEMELSMAIVNTTYDGVGAQEMENLVTRKIESAVSSVTGVDTITSNTSEGNSLVMVEFASGTDMNKAVNDMNNSIEMYKAMLPSDCDDPSVIKIDMGSMAVAQMSVGYEGLDLIQTKRFVEDNVKNKLESVEGVASVTVTGATDRVIEVRLNPTKLSGYSLDLSNVVTAIALENNNYASGNISASAKNMTIRTIGEFESLSDIENVTINTPRGEIIHVRDIAEVVDTYDDDTSYARLNGENAISISISAESDANTVNVVEGVERALKELQMQNPKFRYNMTMEQASYIKNSISSVAESAIIGGVLAIIILLLFLGSMRTALVIGITMPVSIFTTFIGMFFSGMTLNVVSLGGLALGVGMLVDCSVVVIENIFRRRDEVGEEPQTAAIRGTDEVIGAVIASVATTCIVYVPILFIDNMVAVMFKQLAFTIIFSQIASLLVTFLLIPMFSARIPALNESKKYKWLAPFEKILDKSYIAYEKGLRFVLVHRKSFVSVSVGAFALAMIILGSRGMTLMPETDEGSLTVSIETPSGTKLETTDKTTQKIEELIRKRDDVETVFSSVGGGGMFRSGVNSASVTVTLSDKRDKTTTEVCQEIRESLKNISGAIIEVSASNSAMGMSSDEVQWQFSAKDEEKLEEYVKKCEEKLKTIQGVSETSTSFEDSKSEVRINVASDKAMRYGLTSQQIATYVRNATNGSTASKFRESGSEYDINVVYPDGYLESTTDLKNFHIKAPTGEWISLSDVASVTVNKGSTTLTRINQKRTVTLSAKLFGADMRSVNQKFETAIKDIERPDGVSRETGGALQVMIDAMVSLVIAILLGILLMYFVMAAQFENLKQPAIILMTVPLAMIGVVLSLVVTNSDLSVIGCVGILMLVGIIVNNAIVLIEFINTLKKEEPQGDITEHIVRAGKTRMRPILMTSLTSILGYLPMAVSVAEGAETMKPLAIVLLGGLGVGTLLTLFVIPVIYIIFENRQAKKDKRKAITA